MNKGFDFRTQRLNKKGQVVSKNPYRMYVENGTKKIERPPGSGMFYTESGEAWPNSKKGKKHKEENIVEETVLEGDIFDDVSEGN